MLRPTTFRVSVAQSLRTRPPVEGSVEVREIPLLDHEVQWILDAQEKLRSGLPFKRVDTNVTLIVKDHRPLAIQVSVSQTLSVRPHVKGPVYTLERGLTNEDAEWILSAQQGLRMGIFFERIDTNVVLMNLPDSSSTE